MTPALKQLEQEIQEAHGHADGNSLAQLYTRLADIHEAAGDVDAACFYLTHAYVFALESGNGSVNLLQERLHSHDREEPVQVPI